MKKNLFTLIFIVTLFILFPSNVFADATINTESISKGFVTVTGSAEMVVQISKDGQKYNYVLNDSNETNLPLQLGNGTYKIMILKKVNSNQYSVVDSQDVEVTTENNTPFLNSIQLINFDESMISIQELTELLSSATTETSKVEALYDYLLEHMSYDYNKAGRVANVNNYIPVIDDTYISELGICYDMSSLFASILRHNEIPTKLIMGYTPNVPTYHAWNEVYIDGEWLVLDVTYDVGASEANAQFTMLKSPDLYNTAKEY